VHIAFLEPHLRVAGGIRRVLELGNELVRRGHEVTYLLPSSEPLHCTWIECLGRIEKIEESFRRPFDVLVFNEEPQWSLVDLFKRVDLTVYYLLHYAVLYDKRGAHESYRYPVDLRLANSNWTADCIEQEIGVRPTVLLGGIDEAHFRPVGVAKKYDALTYGSERYWKGSREVQEACRQAGIRLESYEGKDLPQEQMAYEYCRARVFVVGSYFEGFGQPGFEALACGVPLVTTDNGGCREYAVHEETALIVPPKDVDALAAAIRRLLEDPQLAARLRRNGLKLVKEKFGSWADSARRFEEIVSGPLDARRRLSLAIDRSCDDPKLETLRRSRAAQVASYTRVVPPPAATDEPQGQRGRRPGLTSIITLSWDQVHHTKGLVESVRANTHAPYELIIVDNGSGKETQEYVESAADICLLNPENRGFAAGMNQGAGAAKGEYLVFINNDAVVPPGWVSRLIETAGLMERVGIVTSTVTAGGSFVTVRAEPHDIVREIMPYSLPPAAVCYLMPREAFQAAGGWCEEYRLGGAEDVDLCFTLWALGWRVLVDERVLIEHQSKGTAGTKLEDWEEVWRANRELLIDRWSSAEPLTAGADEEVESLLQDVRAKASSVPELMPLVDELTAQLARRAQASARERAMLAAGVAQSWRETTRQREMAVGLRNQLRAGLMRRVYRRFLRRLFRK
jgi:glycosyltransferase involved in cell wall biosynthesis/GT2 family glycosyltransferase